MKIAIVTRQMITGGVERALIGMLGSMSNHDEVDLFVERLGGELFEELPDWINIIEIPRKSWNMSKTGLIENIKRINARLQLGFCKKYVKQCELSARSFPIIGKEYDMAIAYHAPNTIPVFYVINNLSAKKKVLWIHGDVETNGMVGKMARYYFEKYDKIIAVSGEMKNVFDKNFKELSEKCKVVHNIVNSEYIRALANESIDEQIEKVMLLTVGRLEIEKGQDIIPRTAKILLDEGVEFIWYLIGEGNLRFEIENKIKKHEVQKQVILLGNIKNPYPYINRCDLYIQTSLTEGWGLAVQEAKILCKPMVVTPIKAFKEQIIDGKNGLIASEITPEALSASIIQLLKQPNLKQKIIGELEIEKSNAIEELQELYKIVKTG